MNHGKTIVISVLGGLLIIALAAVGITALVTHSHNGPSGQPTMVVNYYGHKLTRPPVKVGTRTVPQAPPVSYYASHVRIGYQGGGWYVVLSPAARTYTGTVAPVTPPAAGGTWHVQPTPSYGQLSKNSGGSYKSTPTGSTVTKLEQAIAASQLVALDAAGPGIWRVHPSITVPIKVTCVQAGAGPVVNEYSCSATDGIGDKGESLTVRVTGGSWSEQSGMTWTGPYIKGSYTTAPTSGTL